MKGIVFNVLEAVVGEAHGEGTWDALVDAAGVSGAYTSMGNYPDAELFALVGAASAALKLEPDVIVEWFGTQAIGKFYARYPQFFDPHKDTRSFILTLNEIIHPEVRKLYPGADAPDFDFQAFPDGSLSMVYHSKKKLCSLAIGLVQGAAAHYGQTASITHEGACMKSGGSSCVLRCHFASKGA